jgi:hypothetical protein
VVLAFILWTLYFLLIGALRHRGIWGTLACAVLLSEAINANRIDFRTVYCETVYLLAGLAVVAFLRTLFRKLAYGSLLSAPV